MVIRISVPCPDCEEPLENVKGHNGEPDDIQQAYCSHCDTLYEIKEVFVSLADPLREEGQLLLDNFGHA